jgi:4'-phosphopantetheinyl transferase
VQHGVLRSLLAGYLSCGFDQVDIRSSAHGKPYLAGKDSEGSLQFSLSHSGAYAALAFGRCNSIGVDIEEIREIPELEGIVDQHFTPREKAEMLACQIDWKLKTFYRLWTRKEAVLKAQGEGLLRELDNVDVATGKESGIWKACIKQGSVVEEYSFTDIDGPQGYEAAVAVAGPIGPKSVQLYFMGKV